MEVIPTKPKEEEEMSNEGVIYRISGPVVTATGMEAGMYDVVRVGHEVLWDSWCPGVWSQWSSYLC